MSSFPIHSATILVADDVSENREMLAALLSHEGYRVVSAHDGEEALQLLSTTMVDLALLDVLMPRRNGFDVCRIIKHRSGTQLLPIILVTALDRSEDRVLGIECGADDFLNKPVKKEELIARVKSLLRIKQITDELERAETVLFSLALSVEAKDHYTGGHCGRLSSYSVALGQRIGLPQEQLNALRRGGIVHDLGKISVPEHILQKPGPLTDAERLEMQEHPATGERICRPMRSFAAVLPIIRHHHERIDGTGYPDGLKNGDIPVTARILTTVDVFDALTTDRPYRKALSVDKAFEIIASEVQRGWWDPELAREFESMIRELLGADTDLTSLFDQDYNLIRPWKKSPE